MINATEDEYMYFNLIWYGYHTIYSVVRKFARISCSGDFLFAVFHMAENGYQEILLVFSISAHNTVIVPNFWKFPVLVWQFLPFHCSF